MTSSSLDGKRAIVTGAASGIGRSIARRLSERGASVVAADLDADGLESLSAEASVKPVTCNVAIPEDVDRVVATAGETVEILCNNAGLMDRFMLVDEIPLEEWNRVFAVNVTSQYMFCHRLVPRMVDAGGGVIINIASAAGLRGGRAGAAYTASKHAVVGLTRNIAATYGHLGIRCNAICPGGTRGGARGGHEEGAKWSERGEAVVIGRDRLYPEPGTADQIAAVALFLASDEADRIGGAEIVVDAGALAF